MTYKISLQQGKQLIERVKAEYAKTIEYCKQKGVPAEDLDVLAATEQNTHKYSGFVDPNLSGNISLNNEYPRVKISETKLKDIERIIEEGNLILHPELTDFGFPLIFNVFFGERTPSGRGIVHRLLTFHQYQVPPAYNVDIVSSLRRLRPTLLGERNLGLVAEFKLEPIDETSSKYFY